MIIFYNPTNFSSFSIDCKSNCNKTGTIGGFCNKEDGTCHCKIGFYGEKCEKGRMKIIKIGICRWQNTDFDKEKKIELFSHNCPRDLWPKIGQN